MERFRVPWRSDKVIRSKMGKLEPRCKLVMYNVYTWPYKRVKFWGYNGISPIGGVIALLRTGFWAHFVEVMFGMHFTI